MQLKLSTLAATAALLASANVLAQSSVTVYGLVDSGIEIINNAPDAAKKPVSLSRLDSGNLYGSRIGFRGEEDMGGGLKAVFVLENGYSVDTGATLQGARLFGRQGYVGLKGNWGSLLLGRQNSLMLEWMSKYNTMENATWSSKVHDGAFSDRIDNAIKYVGKFDAVDVSAYYSTGFDSTKGGEVAGHGKAGREVGLGVQYNGGALRAALAFDQKNGQTALLENDTDKHATFGLRYLIGDAELLGGYLRRKQESASAATIDTDLAWLGLNYRIAPQFLVSGSWYHTEVKNSNKNPTSYITMLRYSVSKRTDLYLINSYAKNKNGSALGVNGFNVDIVAGTNQFGTMAGISHMF